MIKKNVYMILLVVGFLNAQDEMNFQKFEKKILFSVGSENQFYNSYGSEYFGSFLAIISLNNYRVSSENKLTDPMYMRLVLSYKNDRYDINSYFLQYQKSIKKVQLTSFVWIQNNIRNTKFGLGIGSYGRFLKKFKSDKLFFSEFSTNIYPLTSNEYGEYAVGFSIMPIIGFSKNYFDISMDLFTYIEYSNNELNYVFRPIVSIGIRSSYFLNLNQ